MSDTTNTNETANGNGALLNQYNSLVETARGLGLTNYRTMQRFRPADSGPQRIEMIQSAIRAAEASAKAVDKQPAAVATEVVEEAVKEATGVEAAVEETVTEAPATVAVDAASPAPAEANVEDQMAKAATPAKKTTTKKAATPAKKVATANKAKATPAPAGTARRGRPPTNGETIKAKTDAYNALVPTATKKGVAWAKVHTSFFGSHEAADAQLKRLRDAIAAA